MSSLKNFSQLVVLVSKNLILIIYHILVKNSTFNISNLANNQVYLNKTISKQVKFTVHIVYNVKNVLNNIVGIAKKITYLARYIIILKNTNVRNRIAKRYIIWNSNILANAF